MAEENKNIEEFFKRFSETYPSQISFQEAHWEAMEAMLDKELPADATSGASDAPPHIASTTSILTVIILLLGVWWNYHIQRPVQVAAGQPTDEILGSSTTPASDVSESVSLSMPKETAIVESTVSQVGRERTGAAALSEERNSESSDAASSVSSVDSPTAIGESEPSARSYENPEEMDSSFSETTVGSTGESSPKPSVPGAVSLEERPVSALTEEESGPRQLRTFELLGLISGRKEVAPEGARLPPSMDIPLVEVEEALPVKSKAPWPRVSLTLSFSPDFSSNELGTYNRTGSEIGLIAEYRFKPRWSLEVGVLSTRKKYKVGGDEYSQPSGFWNSVTHGEVPEWIDADCHVLDIPINIRYRFIENDGSSLSASVGLSSYLMLSEDYHYELSYGDGTWGSGHENNHFLSVGNLQVYYERKLGKYFSVEVAPFLKLPLSGYGHGDIKFHSIGTFISVKRYFYWK